MVAPTVAGRAEFGGRAASGSGRFAALAAAALCALGVASALPSAAHAGATVTGGAGSSPAAASTPAVVTPPAAASLPAAAAVDPAFGACLARLRGEATAAGVPAAAFDRHAARVEPDMAVIDSLNFQPEFTTPIWDYLAGLVDDERAADGRALMKQWSDTLADIESRFGVDRDALVAIWGIESNFGRQLGRRSVVRSLATLSCIGRRQAFFRGQLFATLRILDAGDVDPDKMVGSWAGAFGQTQFMPTTFLETAVDFEGDGRRDIIGSVPDALASSANYLRRAGWRKGERWGYEVRLPKDFDASLAGRQKRRPLSEWVSRGIRRADGSAIAPTDARAALLLPAGPRGPAFVVFRNFDAIYAYNASENYALAISLLSDRLRGEPGLVAGWPTDDPGLSRAERREVQTLLIARGIDIGEVDGIIGTATRRAIRELQPALGMEPDGRAGRRLLEALRRVR
jgi:lytic murein transglycosylase